MAGRQINLNTRSQGIWEMIPSLTICPSDNELVTHSVAWNAQTMPSDGGERGEGFASSHFQIDSAISCFISAGSCVVVVVGSHFVTRVISCWPVSVSDTYDYAVPDISNAPLLLERAAQPKVPSLSPPPNGQPAAACHLIMSPPEIIDTLASTATGSSTGSSLTSTVTKNSNNKNTTSQFNDSPAHKKVRHRNKHFKSNINFNQINIWINLRIEART